MTDDTLPPTGYRSEEDKRKFTTWAGITGALFFMLQFLLPFAVMLAVMPAMMFSGSMFRDAEIEGAVHWRGRIYYIERGIGPNESEQPNTVLKSLELGSELEPQTVVEVPLHEPTLLAGADRLWLVGESAVASYDGTKLETTPHDDLLGSTSPPFFHRGELAVMEETLSAAGLRVFRNGTWEYDSLEGLELADTGIDCCRVRALDIGGITHLFLYKDNTVYHRQLDQDADWAVAAKTGWRWQAVELDGAPAIFTYRKTDGFDRQVVGWRGGADGWKRFFETELGSSHSFGVVPLGQADSFALLSSSFPGSFSLRQVDGGEVGSRLTHGSGFPFPMPFMLIMLIPYASMLMLPLLLALVLSRLMRKHRNNVHVAGDQRAEMATVWRRALAQLVDMAIVGLPFVGLSLAMFSNFSDPEKMAGPAFVFAWMGGMLGSFAFIVVAMLLIAWAEGRYGLTPGKWLAGIRVLGTDLQPCGFGRALIRNLLKAVDGMFNFLVGILLIGLSENWQRLGDMAARTVVVRAAKSED